MKNLKRFVAIFMMAALFSTSFTSCVDNDVDPAVEAIYRGQADLIAAQVALKEAEAALFDAQAAHELAMAEIAEARAEQIRALTEGIENQNAYDEAVRMQELMLLEAETARDVAAAQNAMMLAQQQFENDMAALIAELEAAGALIAATYAQDYADAMGKVYDLNEDKLLAQKAAGDIERDLAIGEIDQAAIVAGLEMDIEEAQMKIAMNNEMIAAYQAVLDDPTSATNEVIALKEQKNALDVESKELEIDIADLENQIVAIDSLLLENPAIIAEYEAALTEHNNYVLTRDGLIEDNVVLTQQIAMYEQALADYDTTMAAYQKAVDDADQAIAGAWAVLGMTDGAGNDVMYDDYFEVDAEGGALDADGVKYTGTTLQEVYANARIDLAIADAALTAANGALTALEVEIAALEGSLNAAAADVALKQGEYDAGIGGATAAVTAAQTGVTNAKAALLLAQTNYTTWKGIFEANPAGYTWSDPGTDTYSAVLGNQDPDTNVSTPSYVEVLTWTNNGVDDNTPATFSATVVTDLPVVAGVTNVVITNGDYSTVLTDAQYAVTSPSVDPDFVYWYEVGADDVADSNLAEFQAATTALGNEDIYDVAPFIGGITLDTGAWADLWKAEVALLEAEDAYDNFGNALEAAKDEYDRLKAIYENELTLLNAAQQAVVDATADYNTADEAADDAAEDVDKAWEDLGEDIGDPADGDPKADPAETLYEERWNAIIDLEEFKKMTEEDIQNEIDMKTAQKETNENYIAELQILIDALFMQVSSLQEAYDEAIATSPIQAELQVQRRGLVYQIMQIKDYQFELGTMANAIQNTIDAIEDNADGYLTEEALLNHISALEGENETQEGIVKTKTDLLATSELTYEALVASQMLEWEDLMDQIEAIDAEIANWEAVAANYKALMEAALS